MFWEWDLAIPAKIGAETHSSTFFDFASLFSTASLSGRLSPVLYKPSRSKQITIGEKLPSISFLKLSNVSFCEIGVGFP